MLPDYELVKATMLESLGDTPASADRRWWTTSCQAGETPGAFYLRVRALGLRRLHGLRSREEVVEQTILSRFVSLLSPECYTHVLSKNPKDGMAASTMVQEFEETRGFARRQYHWNGHSTSQHHPSSSRVPNDLGYTQQSSHGEQHGGGYPSRNYSNSSGYSGSSNSSGYSGSSNNSGNSGSSSTGNNSTWEFSHDNTSKNSFSLVGVRLVGRDLPGQRSWGKGLRGQ